MDTPEKLLRGEEDLAVEVGLLNILFYPSAKQQKLNPAANQ